MLPMRGKDGKTGIERERERLHKREVKETYFDSEWEFFMINVKKWKIQCIYVDLLVNHED